MKYQLTAADPSAGRLELSRIDWVDIWRVARFQGLHIPLPEKHFDDADAAELASALRQGLDVPLQEWMFEDVSLFPWRPGSSDLIRKVADFCDRSSGFEARKAA